MREYLPPRIELHDVEGFTLDGAVCVRGLFSSSWVERMRQADVERLDYRPHPAIPAPASV